MTTPLKKGPPPTYLLVIRVVLSIMLALVLTRILGFHWIDDNVNGRVFFIIFWFVYMIVGWLSAIWEYIIEEYYKGKGKK